MAEQETYYLEGEPLEEYLGNWGIKLNKDSLRSWLKSKDKADVVHDRPFYENCVVAQFLREESGSITVWVGPTCFGISDEDLLLLPDWAAKFVKEVDIAHRTGWKMTAHNMITLIERLEAKGEI